MLTCTFIFLLTIIASFIQRVSRIRIRHFCDDVLSFLPALVWRIGHALRLVGGKYGLDDSHS